MCDGQQKSNTDALFVNINYLYFNGPLLRFPTSVVEIMHRPLLTAHCWLRAQSAPVKWTLKVNVTIGRITTHFVP